MLSTFPNAIPPPGLPGRLGEHAFGDGNPVIVGLPLGALLLQTATGPIEAYFPPSLGLLAAGGLLVGFGTRLGSGCTSGHGVCGKAEPVSPEED